MSSVRILSGVIVGITLAAGTAAADRTMVVLLDATGSMQTLRSDNGLSRFDQAKLDAADRVLKKSRETEGLSKVAVYKFFGTGMVLESTSSPDGFVTPFEAGNVIMAATVTSDLTPLAGAMCAAVDVARTSGTGATTTRFLEVFSDGAENNTIGPPCAGPFSVALNTAPFDSGPPPSWQNLVWTRTTNPLPAIQVDPTLYHDETGAFAASALANVETAKLAALGRPQARAVTLAAAATDADLFAALAADTGGTFTEVVDTAPVPVVGDLDGDFDVDRNDAIIMARRFGAPAIPSFDLDDNGKIGFGDYALLLARFGTGSGTPAPDPYGPGQTVVCNGQTITIDSQVIEASSITIQSTGACHVIIRNSLIVSGAAAINVRGLALVEVDNSIIVGEGQWLNSTGSTLLSAANSVFHGPRKLSGVFAYVDRGGNTFEQ